MTIIQAIQKIESYVAIVEMHRVSRKDLIGDVAEAFTKIRSWKGMRQKEFASVMGVSESYINKVEHGVLMPSRRVLENLTRLGQQNNEKESL
jgi:ribosome-binding protein aMBF1 (putative translation factor)